MFRTSYQRGFLTVFFSCGPRPLELWDVHIKNGHISRFLDPEIKSMVVDIRGNNVSTAYMTCPTNNRVLGITMPFMIMVVKNLKKYFTFEVTILDETGARRRFRVSNFQSTTQILPMSTAMPIGLADGWNQIQFNLAEFTRRAYNKAFIEVQQIKINANIRLRRIYFAEKLTREEDLPAEYRIFLPLPSKIGRGKKAVGEESKTTVIKPASQEMVTSQTMLKTTSQASIVELPLVAPPAEAGFPLGAEPSATVEVSPIVDEHTPVEVETSAGQGEATAGEGEATAGEAESPAENGEATAGEGETTVGEGKDTAGEDEATAGDGKTTAGEGETTAGEGEATAGEGEAPEAVKAPVEESAPVEGEAAAEAPPEGAAAQKPTEDAPAEAADVQAE